MHPLYRGPQGTYLAGMDKRQTRQQAEITPSLASLAQARTARYRIGDVVRHRYFPFRGVIYDVDPEFSNSEEWWLSIPEHIRPEKDQPYYHLLAENEDGPYMAYVSQQNLELDPEGGPVSHPDIEDVFEDFAEGRYPLRSGYLN